MSGDNLTSLLFPNVVIVLIILVFSWVCRHSKISAAQVSLSDCFVRNTLIFTPTPAKRASWFFSSGANAR